jgi:antitoxin component of RelBE/YafQ-DinJ toxin-antitoxin module
VLKLVAVRLDEELIKDVKKICIDMGMTFQDTVKELLERLVIEKQGGNLK